MTRWYRTQGDVKDTLVATIEGVNSLANLTAIEAHVWLFGQPNATLTVSVIDPVARTVRVDLGDVGGWLPTAAEGKWRLEYFMSFADGSKLTWPAPRPDIIYVRRQGA